MPNEARSRRKTEVANTHAERNQTCLEWHAMKAKLGYAAIAAVR